MDDQVQNSQNQDQAQQAQTSQPTAEQQAQPAAPKQNVEDTVKSKVDSVMNKVAEASTTEQEVSSIINVGKGLFGL